MVVSTWGQPSSHCCYHVQQSNVGLMLFMRQKLLNSCLMMAVSIVETAIIRLLFMRQKISEKQSDDGCLHCGDSHHQTVVIMNSSVILFFMRQNIMNSCLMMAVSPQSFARKLALYSSKQQSDDGHLHTLETAIIRLLFARKKIKNSSRMMVVSPQSFAKKPVLHVLQ